MGGVDRNRVFHRRKFAQKSSPIFCSTFDLEHHCPLQRAQPIVDQKERHKDSRNTDRHEPFIADVTARMKDEPLGRKLIIKLFDQRLECRPLEPQTELGDAALEKLLIVQRRPINRFHFRARYQSFSSSENDDAEFVLKELKTLNPS